MKLPLASPLASASPAQETPWDAWTNLKSPIAQIPATVGTGPTVSKRMAPDRYSIASTVAPGVITWPPQQNGEGEGYSQNLPQPQLRLPSTSPEYTNMGVRGSIQSVPSSYLDVVRPSTGQSFTPVSKAGELPANLAALVESTPELARLPPSVRNQVLEELGLLSQVSPGPTTTPSPAQRVPSASVQTTTMPDISSVLSTLPPPVLQQLMATTTPAEAQKLIEAISTASKEKTPSSTPPAAASAVLSMIPEPVRLQILGKATSAELAQIIGVLSKLEQKIPDENPLVSSIQVETILPLSLVQKLPPAVAPLLTKKLDIPPVPPTILLSKSIPEPILSTILGVANPLEIVELTENLEKVEALAPVPTPPIAALLPPTLAAKLPPTLVPVFSKLTPEKVPVATQVPPTVSAEIAAVLAAIPAPLLKEVLTEATLEELTEVVENVAKLEKLTPLPKLPVATLLPPTLLSKLSPALVPLLTKVVVLTPPSTTTTEAPAEVLTVLANIPEQLLTEMLTVATSDELAQIAETISSLEGPAPEKKPISDLLPPSLISKLPAEVVPLIGVPVVIPAKLVSPKPEVIPINAISAIISIIPEPILPAVLAKATPEELSELVDLVVKLDAMPPEAKPLISKLKVVTILPASLLAKIPPSLAPLLEKNIDIATKAPKPGPLLAPPVPTATASVLSILPPAIIPSIIATATPEELAELVADILPPSILPKLSPAITPLLSTEIDTAVLTDLVSPPKILLPETPLVPLATAVVLSVLPPPLIAPIIEKATSEELTELVERVEKLKAIPEEEKALIPSVQVAAILPPSLIEKLPAEVTPLLKKGVAISELPLTIPEVPAAAAPSVPTIVVPPTPAVVAPPSLATVLSVLPPPVVPEILAKATPEELTELAATIAKLESIPAEQMPLLPKIEVAAILAPSLLAKLSPEALPLLEKEVVLPPPAPEKVPPGVTAPTKVVPTLPPSVLPLLPEAVVPEILAKATPEELTELINTVESLEAIPPEALPKLVVGNILPPTLIPKLSPAVLPLLSTEVVIPPTKPIPAATPVTPEPEDIIPPEQKSIPEPLLSTILAVATPTELKEIVETVKELEAVPPEQKPLLPKLPILSVLPATLLSKLPPTVAPLLTLELVVPTEAVGVPVELPVLQAVPEPALSEILAVASPLEVEQLVETLTELEKLPPEQKALLPKPLTIMDVLPPALLSKLPSEIVPLLSKEVIPEAAAPPETVLPEPATPAPVVPSSTEAPPTKAEEKLLTKWAKIILEKTGKRVAPVPGEIPPLQAAWMEWIQLQVNETKKAEAATTTSKPPVLPAPSGEEVTTEYPWTKWLKLKSSTPPAPINPATLVPALDVGTESPEKATLEWLEALEKVTEQPTSAPPPEITPEMEEKVVELLKQLGIENVQLPPEKIPALVAALAVGAVPPVVPPTTSKVTTLPPSDSVPPPPFVPLLPPSVAPPAPVLRPFPPSAYPAYLPPPPFYPLAPRPFWVPSPFNPYVAPPVSPLVPAEPTLPPTTEQATGAPPTINLTQYLIANKLIPAAALPSAPIPITAVAKMLEAQPEPTEKSTSASNEVAESTPRTITSSELAALTPTKFASLLKQILKDCNNSNILVTRSAHSRFKPAFAGPPAGVKRGRRALLPIPSQGVGAPPPQLDQGSSNDLLPLPSLSMPKVETAGTVLDPAYWAAQKSMFLSKLFSTLAKVALNDSAQQQTTTLSPKEQLAKQVNTVLLNSMTRSVKQHQKETEEEEEYESSDEDQQNVDENELVTNDNSEPNLPKEPENPLHKLFKFGVQKTVLSDLSTPAPDPQPIYIYVTSPPPPLEITTTPSLAQQREMINKLKKVYDENKKLKQKVKGKKRKYKTASTSKTTGGGQGRGSSNSHHHTKNHSFRKPNTSPAATTESPVDFELLAKALLVDNKAKK
ncbi:hypothetical protein Ocin01_09662 [Orchesella cincta]|uniref:Uncharacterized protein n=1 Tax=Orchesella cincta TaxID=48709 RepID=A0A1D2MV96_ORCCI|nr:hypothetical protein Ocin01_09662 [Orchesella cincta]